jgi:16S rRNA (guanine527-N7)-methyltransferase
MFNMFVNTFPETSQETLVKIKDYYDLLVKWNRSLNLVQRKTLAPEIFVNRHLIDCWQLTLYLDKKLQVLDVGSGAGLPGILLAIAGFDVHLVEQDLSKASFLKNCKSNLNLSCEVLPLDVFSLNQNYPQLTSRAFSQLDVLLEIQSNVSRETKGVFLKGENYLSEIADAKRKWAFNISSHNSISSEEGHVIEIYNLKRI